MTNQKTYELLEKNTDQFSPICNLYSWSENFDSQNPFNVFLDLIGYSSYVFGDHLTYWKSLDNVLGYLEIDLLADALKMYAEKPTDVRDFIDLIFNEGI